MVGNGATTPCGVCSIAAESSARLSSSQSLPQWSSSRWLPGGTTTTCGAPSIASSVTTSRIRGVRSAFRPGDNCWHLPWRARPPVDAAPIDIDSRMSLMAVSGAQPTGDGDDPEELLRRMFAGGPNDGATAGGEGSDGRVNIIMVPRLVVATGGELAALQPLPVWVARRFSTPGQPAGREGDLWAMRAVRKAFPDLRFTLDVAFEDGDVVTGRWTMTGTHSGALDLLGLPATGRPVTMSGQEIFRARDGLFSEVWHLEDVGALQRALDLEPPKAMLRLAAARSARRYRRATR
jgi:predicted ester cyclase